MSHNREHRTRQDECIEEVEETKDLLKEYAEEREITIEKAADDILNNWTLNWCQRTPSFVSDGLRACKVAGKIQTMAKESEEVEDAKKLVRWALSDEIETASKA